MAKKLDYHWIVPGLAQGAYPDPPQAAFEVFDVVAFMAEELQPHIQLPRGKFVFKLPLDDDVYRPVPPAVGQALHQTAAAISTYLAAGHHVLSTCAQGRNRSGILTALILMHTYRMTPEQAIKLVQQNRRGHDALANTMFTQWLLAQRRRR
jgi:protein-tyrosine phosphatase